MVRLQAIVVIDDVIVGGTDSPPVSSLADQVEVIPAEKWGSGEKGSQSRVRLKQRQSGGGRFIREPSTCCVCKPDTLSWVL